MRTHDTLQAFAAKEGPEGVYGYPRISRSGLGNILFPWARAWVWCKANSVPMIAPSWLKVRIGPYLRRERDKRHYWRLFHSEGYITGLRKRILLSSKPAIAEDDLTHDCEGSLRGIVTFSGTKQLFEPILDCYADIHNELVRITKPRYLPQQSRTPFIAIHIRRGDFAVPSTLEVLRRGEFNYQIPDEWYRSVLAAVRGSLGQRFPVRVFSDGSEAQLRFILEEPSVELRGGAAAITDLLEMSTASVLIASGSTFSDWAAFLGRMPVVWHTGQMKQHLYCGDGRSSECEVDSGGNVPREWLEALRRRATCWQ